ncbi:HhH2 [Musa troglodytarum]|uniref:Exonuclease 1 n=1 Tax=Musa troglodytarum TaxID=320322 RepID=A0A9E7F4E5_9LILI|nr:HhH2 [Musa troglodytarum]URD88794.1 HhH2 [Musa troglodytarum]
MGIQGLLPLLKSIMAPIHVEELRGQTVAVDAYSWLHKGAFSCATQLCKGLPTSKYPQTLMFCTLLDAVAFGDARHIDYCMHRVNLLKHHGVKPILVFDGGILPMKIEQETKRSRTRKENLARAMEHETLGNSSAAYECYQKAVDISPLVAFELIQVLKQEHVDYIVAPYEADAQMTFLSINSLVDAVITEDSDLIPFGCSRIIFKMDKFGQGVEFQSLHLGKNKELDLTGFTKRMLLEMCIFSGCDYLPSVPGMGLKRAHALVKRLKSYDKLSLTEFTWLPQGIAKEIAQGDIDPLTKMPFQGKDTCRQLMLGGNCLEKESVPLSGRKKLDLPVQKNLLTNYFCLASLEARRKFRAPKVMPKKLVMMDSDSPSSEKYDSESLGSAEEATCINNHTAHAPVNASTTDDSLPAEICVGDTTKVLMEDKSTNHSQKVGGLPLNSGLKDLQCSSLLPELKHETCKPFLTSHKEYDVKLKMADVDVMTKSTKRKVIVKSSYFRHKLSDDNDRENQNDGTNVNNENCDCTSCDCPVSNGASCGNACLKSGMKKRKPGNISDKQLGDLGSKNARTTSTYFEEDSEASDLNNEGKEVQEKGKFGCDISHLNNYTGIAEKSMEKFVALISSYRYTSSGSRASGLRAPLKDVQNTCSSRPTVAPISVNKFAYSSKK